MDSSCYCHQTRTGLSQLLPTNLHTHGRLHPNVDPNTLLLGGETWTALSLRTLTYVSFTTLTRCALGTSLLVPIRSILNPVSPRESETEHNLNRLTWSALRCLALLFYVKGKGFI